MKKLLLPLFLFFPLTATASPFSCANPVPYCKNMSSCAEAQFFLNECGKRHLDRDNDGIPCENVCGKSGKKTKAKKGKSEKKAKKSKGKKKG